MNILQALVSSRALAALTLLTATGAGQSIPVPPPSCVKWVQTSDPELWIPDSIALADFGASVITARSLTGGHVSVHASGTCESVFEIPSNPNVRKVMITGDTILKNVEPEMVMQRDRRAREA